MAEVVEGLGRNLFKQDRRTETVFYSHLPPPLYSHKTIYKTFFTVFFVSFLFNVIMTVTEYHTLIPIFKCLLIIIIFIFFLS